MNNGFTIYESDYDQARSWFENGTDRDILDSELRSGPGPYARAGADILKERNSIIQIHPVLVG